MAAHGYPHISKIYQNLRLLFCKRKKLLNSFQMKDDSTKRLAKIHYLELPTCKEIADYVLYWPPCCVHTYCHEEWQPYCHVVRQPYCHVEQQRGQDMPCPFDAAELHPSVIVRKGRQDPKGVHKIHCGICCNFIAISKLRTFPIQVVHKEYMNI